MNKPYLFSETAFHHEGDFDYMVKMVEKSAAANVDGIKFQVLFDLSELLSVSNPAYEKLKDFVFSRAEWCEIFKYSIKKKLDIIVMPLDQNSFDLVEEFRDSVRFVELHSVAFYDDALKKRLKNCGKDVILGVGGRTLPEIENAIHFFEKKIKVLMVGFQAFPSSINDIRLRKIAQLSNLYPEVAIGYADHSSYMSEWNIYSNLIAFSLGARFFEKHITVKEGDKRVDTEAAIGYDTLQKIRTLLNEAHGLLFGYSDPFEMTPAEMVYRNRQKMVVAKEHLSAGTRLQPNHLQLKMTGATDGFPRIEDLLEKKMIVSCQKDQPIKRDYVGE